MSHKLAGEFIDRIIALRPVLLRHAAFLIGSRADIGSPEDFVQDTLVTAFQHGNRFDDGSLSGWLTAILRNHISNARRRANRRNLVLEPLDATGGGAGMNDFPVVATQGLALDLEDAMAALSTLSSIDQEIIWLARVDGLSPEEIGARLGLAAGSVYSRLSRATTKLRATYDAPPAASLMRPRVPFRHAA
ncbi:sigma-24 (FecI-like) [Rhodopseudomonas palustris HaA2]|uniref:Sigma-24 (FecI-like) n=1 Tax=Rhodopseudomonas palustris (strain HaA2) TaxID=316058 RepID=Q2IVJ9_RHOP2|nr:RNA polymerase sigma factor [Rhodopseudomonas palustris]ABD07761.1 sigma-24 (FecI-like) [Rhodopseudomonas palustris HaA2]